MSTSTHLPTVQIKHLVVQGTHEAIIDSSLWDKANERIQRDATGIPRQYSGSFPLTGMTKCPSCGSFMTSLLGGKRKDGTRKRYYVCGNYHNKGNSVCQPNLIPADWLEKSVFERLIAALNSEEVLRVLTGRINALIKSLHDPRDKPDDFSLLTDRLKKLELQKKKIQDAAALGSALYTEEEAIQRIKEIRDEIAKVEETLSTLHIKAEDSLPVKIEPVTTAFLKEQLKDFLHLIGRLEPIELRRLLQASIEKIEATKNELKHVYFSFIVRMPELDPSGLIHNDLLSAPVILQALYLDQKHYLFMIRFPTYNPKQNIMIIL